MFHQMKFIHETWKTVSGLDVFGQFCLEVWRFILNIYRGLSQYFHFSILTKINVYFLNFWQLNTINYNEVKRVQSSNRKTRLRSDICSVLQDVLNWRYSALPDTFVVILLLSTYEWTTGLIAVQCIIVMAKRGGERI